MSLGEEKAFSPDEEMSVPESKGAFLSKRVAIASNLSRFSTM
jgi:hypothetical protein